MASMLVQPDRYASPDFRVVSLLGPRHLTSDGQIGATGLVVLFVRGRSADIQRDEAKQFFVAHFRERDVGILVEDLVGDGLLSADHLIDPFLYGPPPTELMHQDVAFLADAEG